MLRHLLDPLASLIYPRSCGSCGSLVESVSDGDACAQCWAATRLFRVNEGLCNKCGYVLGDRANASAGTCDICVEHAYDRAIAAGVYHDALAATVLALKRSPFLSRRTKELLRETFERLGPISDPMVVPVPLSKKRRLERGFNQAEILARSLSSGLKLKLDAHSLVRTADTPMHRAAMDRTARLATVKNAFQVVRPGLIDRKNVILVDDVLTSGSTASECARVLKRSGAASVIVLTLARAA